MSVIRATAYPSRYADEGWQSKECQPALPSAGKFCLQFEALKVGMKRKAYATKRLRELAVVIGKVIEEKPVYDRRERYYAIGGWTAVANGFDDSVTVHTASFEMDKAEKTYCVLEALHNAGYAPCDEVSIRFMPDVYDKKLVTNINNIVGSRNALITQALGLVEETRIVVDKDLVFDVPLNDFSCAKIEACITLLRQASLMAANTGKARMKPCDESNPKYQMRSWLLRLGFIGEQFARPRQTLLSGLEGDGAFFTNDGKEKAAMKRKAKRMVG